MQIYGIYTDNVLVYVVKKQNHTMCMCVCVLMDAYLPRKIFFNEMEWYMTTLVSRGMWGGVGGVVGGLGDIS